MVSADVYLLALVPAVLWGFTPVLSKRGMAAGGSSLQASLVVVVVDSSVYWLLLLALEGPSAILGLPLFAVGVFFLGGLVGTSLGRLATFTGVDRVGASINVAGISTRPLFATALAFVWLGEAVAPETALGILVLVTGLVVLAVSRGGDLGGWRRRDLVYPLAAAAFFAVGNVVRRFGLTETSATVLQGVALNETAAFVGLAAYAVASDRRDVFHAPRETYAYFTGSGLITAVALLSLFAAFDAGPVAVVDPLAGTSPLFTTLFAYFLLRDLERVTAGVVVGALLVVVGAGVITVF